MTQARIAALLLADRRDSAVLVVMRRIDQHVIGQGEQLLGHALVKGRGAAVLEVCAAAAAVDQQGVAAEQAVIAMVDASVSEVAVGVAGCGRVCAAGPQ